MSNDSRLNKFEELAEKRVNEAIRRLRLLGNLANKSNYKYTDEHVRQIFKVLDDEMKTLKQRFQGRNEQNTLFQFKIRDNPSKL